jgi:hypothetical protein
MPRSGSGEQSTGGMLGRFSGLASCTGEAMESPKTENKLWCFSRKPEPIKFQRHGGCSGSCHARVANPIAKQSQTSLGEHGFADPYGRCASGMNALFAASHNLYGLTISSRGETGGRKAAKRRVEIRPLPYHWGQRSGKAETIGFGHETCATSDFQPLIEWVNNKSRSRVEMNKRDCGIISPRRTPTSPRERTKSLASHPEP